MKKNNQYHWTQIEASPSQYNWQQSNDAIQNAYNQFSAWEDAFYLEWRRVHLQVEGRGSKEIIPLLHRWYESGKTPQEAFALFLQEVKR